MGLTITEQKRTTMARISNEPVRKITLNNRIIPISNAEVNAILEIYMDALSQREINDIPTIEEGEPISLDIHLELTHKEYEYIRTSLRDNLIIQSIEDIFCKYDLTREEKQKILKEIIPY